MSSFKLPLMIMKDFSKRLKCWLWFHGAEKHLALPWSAETTMTLTQKAFRPKQIPFQEQPQKLISCFGISRSHFLTMAAGCSRASPSGACGSRPNAAPLYLMVEGRRGGNMEERPRLLSSTRSLPLHVPFSARGQAEVCALSTCCTKQPFHVASWLGGP